MSEPDFTISGTLQNTMSTSRLCARGATIAGKKYEAWSPLSEESLLKPLSWKSPRHVEVLSDLFHENVTDEMRDRIFAVMALCPQHAFHVLTKRPERMLAYLAAGKGHLFQRWGFWASYALHVHTGVNDVERDSAAAPRWPLPNVWLGVSVEDQKTADARIPLLLQTPAAVRFVSAEPLLEALDLEAVPLPDAYLTMNGITGVAQPKLERDSEPDDYRYFTRLAMKIDWVIVGGESGPGARPMHPKWARNLRDQCVAAGVPFFFKQWGEWISRGPESMGYAVVEVVARIRLTDAGHNGNDLAADGNSDTWMQRVGKKAAGDLLDGVRWHQMPEARG